MTFQYPFQCPYIIAQGYSDNAGNRYNGPLDGHHHGALDIVPLNNGQAFPALIYPLFAGSEISIQDTDPVKGKGVKERILLDEATVTYFQDKGVLPNPIPAGQVVCLDVLYWHMLDITDQTGNLDERTPIGHAGNTGAVYHNNLPVPDDQKGVPPYLGLHLHLETVFGSVQGMKFNLDKDPQGRIDPTIVLAKAPIKIHFIGWNDKEKGVYIAADTMDRLQAITQQLPALGTDYQFDETEYNLGKRPW